MLYTTSQDIWAMTESQMRQMQPGQWVHAGRIEDKGMFLGVKTSGSVVVAWAGNARSHGGNRAAYIKSLRQYAKGC
jgi:hypothetical protein